MPPVVFRWGVVVAVLVAGLAACAPRVTARQRLRHLHAPPMGEGASHACGCSGGEETTVNDEVVVGGLVVTVFQERHQGDPIH